MMGYLHIDNLYKNQTILLMKECYALEKIHGTSAHISYKENKLSFFSGGAKHEQFIKLFDSEKLISYFVEKELPTIIIFGEAYGGKMQGMRTVYGNELKFIVFDVNINSMWMTVPEAHQIANSLDLEFVHYEKIPCELEYIDKERDKYSVQSIRNGMGEKNIGEGVVLRPLAELKLPTKDRLIAKHKRPEFRETLKVHKIKRSKEELEILSKADDIAIEWVTTQRLNHVMDKIIRSEEPTYDKIPELVKAMIEDVFREAKNEIVESKSARKAIGKRTVKLFKKHIEESKQ